MDFSKQTAIRLAPEMVERLDRYAQYMTSLSPGRAAATRADAIRSLLADALTAFEQSQAPSKAKPKRR